MARRYQISFAAPTVEAIQFLEEETGVPFGHLDLSTWFAATAWNDHGAVVGVLLAEPRNYFDWHLSVAIADQRFMTRRLLRAIFRTLFTRAARITALVEPDNRRAVDQMRRMGFVYEGFLRLGIEGRRDALMFGMLADDCRWLYPGNHPPVSTIIPTDLAGAHLHG